MATPPSPPIIEWTEANIKSHQNFSQTLEWSSLCTIFQAAHNPRSCTSKVGALKEIANVVKGDMAAIMGWFPFLAHHCKVPDSGAQFGSHINNFVNVFYDKYVLTQEAGQWDTAWTSFVNNFEKQCHPTEVQKKAMCALFQERIMQFFEIGLKASDAPGWVMIRPYTGSLMSRFDTDHSDQIGKIRSEDLEAAQHSRQVLALSGLHTVFHTGGGSTPAFQERLKQQQTIAMNGLIFMCQQIVADRPNYAGKDIVRKH